VTSQIATAGPGGFCCKSRFAKIVKILRAAGAFFSYGSEGPHRRTLNSQAISAARLRLYESSVALHSKNSPEIRTDATFDFYNKIGAKRTYDAMAKVLQRVLDRFPRIKTLSLRGAELSSYKPLTDQYAWRTSVDDAGCRPVFAVCTQNSLLLDSSSLFFKRFSLLIRVGNCWKKGCSAGVFRYAIRSERAEIAKFPVEFPDNREFSWRQVRSALRRQPRIPAFCQASQETQERAVNPGFSRIGFGLPTPALPKLRRKSRKVSGRFREYSLFAETIGGDRFDQASKLVPRPDAFLQLGNNLIGDLLINVCSHLSLLVCRLHMQPELGERR
jgi:hypothetical protein